MGGGSLRTAAKAGLFSQYRSPVPFFGLPSSSSSSAPASGARAARAPPPPSSISLHCGDNGRRQAEAAGAAAAAAASAAEWPSWEVDDWGFARWKEEDDADLMSPATRLVFGPVPTLAEAKEATSDLKVALDKVHFSSTIADDNEKFGRGPNIVESSSIVPLMPRPVVQAFSLLQESPEAQSVVASLACDKNVWDAVMKNEKVMEFYRNHQPTSSTESVAQNALAEGSSENFSDPSADNSISSVLADVMKNMKNNVREMVGSISNFVQDFFLATETYCTTIMRGSNSSHYDATGTSSFIALAIAVILVVLVKRGSSS